MTIKLFEVHPVVVEKANTSLNYGATPTEWSPPPSPFANSAADFKVAPSPLPAGWSNSYLNPEMIHCADGTMQVPPKGFESTQATPFTLKK